MINVLIIGSESLNVTLYLVHLATMQKRKCSVLDLTRDKKLKFVIPITDEDKYPYFYGDSMVTDNPHEIYAEKPDVRYVLADSEEQLQIADIRCSDAIICTNMLYRNLRGVDKGFPGLLSNHRLKETNKRRRHHRPEDVELTRDNTEELNTGWKDVHLSFAVFNAFSMKYSVEALLHKLGISLSDEDIKRVPQNFGDLNQVALLDMTNKIDLKKLSKPYRETLGELYLSFDRECSKKAVEKSLKVKLTDV